MARAALVLGAIIVSASVGWTADQLTVTPKGDIVVIKQPPLAVTQAEPAAFVAYYWRARPGRAAEYNQYIREVAERIDEDARKWAVFEEVRTVMPTPGPKREKTRFPAFFCTLRSGSLWPFDGAVPRGLALILASAARTRD